MLWTAHAAVPGLDRPVLLMSEQGLGDTLQFVRYALALQNNGVDVTVLSQPPLVKLLHDAVGLRQVDDRSRPRRKKSAIHLATADEPCTTDGLHQRTRFRFQMVIFEPKLTPSLKWDIDCNANLGTDLIALHWQGNPEHEHSLYSRGRSLKFNEWLSTSREQKSTGIRLNPKRASQVSN